MDDFLTDQQRAEQVRNWLRENGWYLLGGIVLGLAGLFGWRAYQGVGQEQAEAASALYQELQDAIRVDRTVRAEELVAQLARDYGRTPYVDQAHLAMARMKMDRNALEQAATYLGKVADGGGTAEMRYIARLRLARVLVQQEKYQDALRRLEVPANSAFVARYHEVRGDVYYAMGKSSDARAEYEKALQTGQPGVVDQALLQAKLDDLGGAASGTDAVIATPTEAESAVADK